MTASEYIKQSPAVHTFAKDTYEEAKKHDPVDAIHDVELVLQALKEDLAAYTS
jgi:hypothetical protein